MVFTTTLFTFSFFPMAVLLWLIGKFIDNKLDKTRVADIILVITSFIFFGWKNFDNILWILVFVGAVYFIGNRVESAAEVNDEKLSKRYFVIGVTVLLILLGYYKYKDFSIEIVNRLFNNDIAIKTIFTPLGISFITFTAISYLADIKMRKAKAGNLLDCALYLTFFPKLISGPIVLWRDFNKEIQGRILDSSQIVDGIRRICYGFAKKVILADTFGMAIANIDSSYASSGIDSPTAWLAVILYWLQIYYDFSGYSDIAIGISKIFGFELYENFRFPYLSKSIAEFWRRWHISLGSWFREYIYFPLGGSRRGNKRTIFNLAVVFALTGIWHGAGFNYILWGAINGFFVIIDHILKNNEKWNKFPGILKWLGTTIIAVAFWELFRFQSIHDAYSWLCVMIKRNVYYNYTFSWDYFVTPSLMCFIAIGFLGATVLGLKPIQAKINQLEGNVAFEAVRNLLCLVLFVVSIIFMLNSSYSPFIYFQY